MEGRTIRVCDTVAWFPTKVTIPLASSTDLVLAGIQDVVKALKNPSQGSPLTTRTDSQVQALTDLNNLLANIITTGTSAQTPKTKFPATTESGPLLRVIEQLVPTVTTPVLRVETPALVPTTADNATYDNSSGPIGKQRHRCAFGTE